MPDFWPKQLWIVVLFANLGMTSSGQGLWGSVLAAMSGKNCSRDAKQSYEYILWGMSRGMACKALVLGRFPKESSVGEGKGQGPRLSLRGPAGSMRV